MSGMNVQIDEKLVRPIVEAEIQAAVVREMEKQPELMSQMVGAVLRMKVDSDGKPSTYSNAHDYITWAFKRAIQEAAKQAITDYLQGNADAFKQELDRQIRANSKSLAAEVIRSLVELTGKSWRMSVNLKLPDV